MTDLPAVERRPVALFCLEAALRQLKTWQTFRLGSFCEQHTVDYPTGSIVEQYLCCFLGRSVACPLLSVTISLARGQLEHLL